MAEDQCPPPKVQQSAVQLLEFLSRAVKRGVSGGKEKCKTRCSRCLLKSAGGALGEADGAAAGPDKGEALGDNLELDAGESLGPLLSGAMGLLRSETLRLANDAADSCGRFLTGDECS